MKTQKIRAGQLMLLTAAIYAGTFMSTANAKIVSHVVDYQVGGQSFEGYVAYDDALKGKRPGVLVVHQWLGLTDYEKGRARQLAELGYVAFAPDIYGKGIRPSGTDEAGALAMRYKGDRTLLRERVNAGFDQLLKNSLVDQSKVAAIGYCFGGTTVLELALSGAKVNGVVSFHGGLDAPAPNDAKNIKGKVLALAGADDPFQKPEDLAAFQSEMRDNKVDWQLTSYGGAVHSFTQPDPGFVDPGARYNEKADKRSWQAMKDFFAEIFKST